MGQRRTPASRFTRRQPGPRPTTNVAVLRRVEAAATGQLALFDTPAAALVAPVKTAATVQEMTDHNPSRRPPLAALGAVLTQVLEFHQAFDLPREPFPTAQIEDAVARLRVRLLREEVEEFIDATDRGDLVDIADALADIVYVAYGSAVTYGIDLDAVVDEVHRANMSKLDLNGRPVMREDGKVMKSSRYTPPDVPSVLAGQLALFDSSFEPLASSTAS